MQGKRSEIAVMRAAGGATIILMSRTNAWVQRVRLCSPLVRAAPPPGRPNPLHQRSAHDRVTRNLQGARDAVNRYPGRDTQIERHTVDARGRERAHCRTYWLNRCMHVSVRRSIWPDHTVTVLQRDLTEAIDCAEQCNDLVGSPYERRR
jgi:hypothetical protein